MHLKTANILIFLLFFMTPVPSISQGFNLLKNPDFEEYKGRGTSYLNNIAKATHWEGINTADYFNEDEEVRKSYAFRQQHIRTYKAMSGKAYAGLRIQKKYREYIQGELEKPLEKGVHYKIAFYISLARHCLYQLNYFSFCLVTTPLNINTVESIDNPVNIPIDTGKIKKEDWYLIEYTYKAKGGERYIVFGNFDKKPKKSLLKISDASIDNKKMYKLMKKSREAYYYLDKIFIRERKSETIDIPVKKANMELVDQHPKEIISQEEIDQGESVVLKNIFFDFDESTLLPESYVELNKLYDLLLLNPQYSVSITGYTDSQGDDGYNLGLSRDRAKAVAEYLIRKGISSQRVKYKGMGSQGPIADNTTEEGRSKNRRVEFTIIK